MGYKDLQSCIEDLEKNGHLVRIKEEVDPYLEMAAIQHRVFQKGGPAILFENVKGCQFQTVSNLFGSLERSQFLFRDSLDNVKKMVELKNDPVKAIKNPFKNIKVFLNAFKALPKKVSKNKNFIEGKISDLPQIIHWPMDGGAFVTLPMVYTEDMDSPGVMKSNLGMYRIQLSGNEYIQDQEIGLHYQLHRGIGVHQTKANNKGEPLKVSIFVGGPPSLSLAAVMPLPEGLSEMTFAGALGNRRFRHYYEDGFCIASDADFVICGEVYPMENKPEGPFGDHLGYYSLKHDFPLMKVRKVLYKKNAIWPFTVVGRPPQEDTSFGALVHDISGSAIPKEIPGLKEVNAVDAAGVHPLLLAVGQERYIPYQKTTQPQEILTIANHILGFGQLSLAKYLFIAAEDKNAPTSTHHIQEFFIHILERINTERDIHFYTKTTIDTLDYSGSGLNEGSKVVIAAAGDKVRELASELPLNFEYPSICTGAKMVMPGVLALGLPKYIDEKSTALEMKAISDFFIENPLQNIPMIVVCDDANFVSETLNNFLWVTFTRSNPAVDMHGVDAYTKNKHWGCKGAFIIDARIKPNHAPPLVLDVEVEKKVDRLGLKGASLHGII